MLSFSQVLDASGSDEATLRWCMEVGLLERQMLCSCFGAPRMKLYEKDGLWRCGRAGCRKTKSVRANSVFAGSRLPIRRVLRMLCCWCSQQPVTVAAEAAGVSKRTAVPWYERFRSICAKAMASTEMSVGGQGHVVEIDETSLKKKSKYGKGKRYPDVWLFGGVDRTTGKWFGVITHEDRTKITLSHLIRKHIKPG